MRVLVLGLCLVLILTAQAVADSSQRVRGVIVAATETTLTLRTGTGAIETVGLTPKTGYGTSTPASLRDLVSGEFLGITSKRVGTRNLALSITIFPETLRGIGEGSYPWDSVPDRSGAKVDSTMTNGTVAPAGNKMTASTMTNGNVAAAAGAAGAKRLTVTYKGGQQIIDVTAATQVLKLALATRAVLAPGQSTFVVAEPGASGLVADYVNVGLDGIRLGF